METTRQRAGMVRSAQQRKASVVKSYLCLVPKHVMEKMLSKNIAHGNAKIFPKNVAHFHLCTSV
jgi:hypothetical protein